MQLGGFPFSTTNNRKKNAAFIWCSKRVGFCASQLDNFDILSFELCADVLSNWQLVLHRLLLSVAAKDYNLKAKSHEKTILAKYV